MTPDTIPNHLYIAGPMTGIPQFNFPTFDTAAEHLRSLGFEIQSPAELDDPETREAALASPDGAPGSGAANDETWGDFLSRDVKLIADVVEGVAVLPGWETSRGARLETFVARLCGKPVYEYQGLLASTEDAPLRLMLDWELNEVLGYGDPGANGHTPDEAVEALGIKIIPDERMAVGEVAWYDGHGAPPLAEQRVAAGSPPISASTPIASHVGPLPDGETRVTNETTGGQKGTKPRRAELLPFDVLVQEVSLLYAAGASKYEDNNWRKGYDWSLSMGALQRHFADWYGGQDNDPECTEIMGQPVSHLAAVVFHALALLWFKDHCPELDDRPSTALLD